MASAQTSLGARVREARLLHGLTLSQVGDQLGLANGNFVGMVERGERNPSDDTVMALASVLGLPSRELLTLKYAGNSRTRIGSLLKPPEPRYGRLRRFMLGTCQSPSSIAAEFSLGPYTTTERLLWQILLEQLVLPEVDSDGFAPRRLREYIASWRRRKRRNPSARLDAAWFEREAELFVPWARSRFEGWTADLDALTMTLKRSAADDDQSVLKLVPTTDVGVQSTSNLAPDLASLLLAEGLHADDVDEIVTLVDLKKRRRARAALTKEKNIKDHE